ncbi:MAG: class I SAM-dependent DNA methyltransferase [Candidatus Howiella sp.]|jgi:SAM-dependent methyltransferase
MPGYGAAFAAFYDRLIGDVCYGERAAYLLDLFERFGRRPEKLLDLACGTGNISYEMSRRGIEVLGVDPSPDMLTEAEAKRKAGDRVFFICQPAEALELGQTVDGAVCCLDGVNHFDGSDGVRAAFSRVAAQLSPGGLFLFDVNSLYKQREILGNNTFVYDMEEVYLVWQNTLQNGCDVRLSLDFFCRGEDGLYDRISEEFTEYGYSVEELEAFLTAAGLEPLACFGDMTDRPPAETCDRLVFVAKKR